MNRHKYLRPSPRAALALLLALIVASRARAEPDAQQQKPEVREVYARPVTAFGKQWMLRLTADPDYALTFRLQGQEQKFYGCLLLLSRAEVAEGQDQANAEQKVWRNITSGSGVYTLEEYAAWLQADACVDGASRQIYQVTAARNSPTVPAYFMINKIGWDDVVSVIPPDREFHVSTSEESKAWDAAHILRPPLELLQDIRRITAVQIEKQQEDLIVTTTLPDKSLRRFAVSLKTREWRKVTDPNAKPDPEPQPPEPDAPPAK